MGSDRLTFGETLLLRARRFLRNTDFKGVWRMEQFLSAKGVPSREVISATRYGFTLKVNPSVDVYQRMIFEEGWYEPGTIALMSRMLKKGDTFLDVGANIRLMSLAASRVVGCHRSRNRDIQSQLMARLNPWVG